MTKKEEAALLKLSQKDLVELLKIKDDAIDNLKKSLKSSDIDVAMLEEYRIEYQKLSEKMEHQKAIFIEIIKSLKT